MSVLWKQIVEFAVERSVPYRCSTYWDGPFPSCLILTPPNLPSSSTIDNFTELSALSSRAIAVTNGKNNKKVFSSRLYFVFLFCFQVTWIFFVIWQNDKAKVILMDVSNNLIKCPEWSEAVKIFHYSCKSCNFYQHCTSRVWENIGNFSHLLKLFHA